MSSGRPDAALRLGSGAWLSRQEQLRRLRLVMARELTPRQREMLMRYYWQQQTMAQIARELGVNRSTVSRTIRRGEERLRRCLAY